LYEPAEHEMMSEGNAGGDKLDEGKAIYDKVTVNSVKG
jgi:hypothetical protein